MIKIQRLKESFHLFFFFTANHGKKTKGKTKYKMFTQTAQGLKPILRTTFSKITKNMISLPISQPNNEIDKTTYPGSLMIRPKVKGNKINTYSTTKKNQAFQLEISRVLNKRMDL